MSSWPNFEFGDLYTYSYYSTRQFTKEKLRPYQFNFMLLGPDRPKFLQMSFNNDSLCRFVPVLVWEGLDHIRIRYHTADELILR